MCAQPFHGKFTWAVRVRRTRLNMGMVFVGVCNLKATCAWGLCPFDGRLHRLCRAEDGSVSYLKPPPQGYPDGNSTHVLVDHAGKPATWISLGCGHGTLITCTADGSGGLAFRVDDGPWCAVPNFAFPHDAPLRRWAFVPDKEDQVYHEEEEMFIPV